MKIVELLPNDINSNGFNYWNYIDWLVDYSAGFVRRGLSGELIALLASYYDPRAIVLTLSWGIFLIFAIGYFWMCFRAIRWIDPLGLIAALFLPWLLFFSLFDHKAFGRKEIVGYIPLLLHLFIVERYYVDVKETDRDSRKLPFRRYLRRSFLLLGFLLPITVFIHEATFFLFVPIHMIISWTVSGSSMNLDKKNLWQIISPLIILYIPVLLAFGTVSLFASPSYNMVKDICLNWEAIGGIEVGNCLSGVDLPGGFGTLHWDLYHAATFTWWHYRNSIFALFTIFLTFGVINFYYISKVTKSIHKILIYKNIGITPDSDWYSLYIGTKYFVFPALITLPLYWFGIDYGRWFAVTSINYVVVVLFRSVIFFEFENKNNFNSPLISKIENSRNLNTVILNGRTKLRQFFDWILLAFVILFTRLPHCCASNPIEFLIEPIQALINSGK